MYSRRRASANVYMHEQRTLFSPVPAMLCIRSGMARTARHLDPKGLLEKIPSRTVGLVRLAAAPPGFYIDRVPVEREEDIKRALAAREAIFLDFLRARVYARADSPYLKLLKHAGCEFSDLSDQVGRHGLEGALARLAAAGVYLTAPEMKGKTDVVRGG